MTNWRPVSSGTTCEPSGRRPLTRKLSSLSSKCGPSWHSTQAALPMNSLSPRLAEASIAVMSPAA